jgi:predicted nucleic acid-binding protein
MTVAIDSTVLIYAHLEADSEKGRRSIEVLRAVGFHGGVIPVQVLGEFLWIVRRRRPDLTSVALEAVETLPSSLILPPLTRDDIGKAGRLAADHRLQFWDVLIRVVASRAGATHLLSEDMQDAAALDGLKIVNPFDPRNQGELDRLLPTL